MTSPRGVDGGAVGNVVGTATAGSVGRRVGGRIGIMLWIGGVPATVKMFEGVSKIGEGVIDDTAAMVGRDCGTLIEGTATMEATICWVGDVGTCTTGGTTNGISTEGSATAVETSCCRSDGTTKLAAIDNGEPAEGIAGNLVSTDAFGMESSELREGSVATVGTRGTTGMKSGKLAEGMAATGKKLSTDGTAICERMEGRITFVGKSCCVGEDKTGKAGSDNGKSTGGKVARDGGAYCAGTDNSAGRDVGKLAAGTVAKGREPDTVGMESTFTEGGAAIVGTSCWRSDVTAAMTGGDKGRFSERTAATD